MTASWAFYATGCAFMAAVVIWIWREEGRKAGLAAIGLCALSGSLWTAGLALDAATRPPPQAAVASPLPEPARREAAGWPFRLARCAGQVSPAVPPMLAQTAEQESFMIPFKPGVRYYPGCGPVAVASICAHYRSPASLARREIEIDVAGSPATWPVGGRPYAYGWRGMAGLAELVTDVGALSGTRYDYKAPGSMTALAGLENALDALGFRWRACRSPTDLAKAVAGREPAIVVVDGLTDGCSHFAVVDGAGSDSAGSRAFHLRFCLRGAEDGWFSERAAGTGISVAAALGGVAPSAGVANSPAVVREWFEKARQ